MGLIPTEMAARLCRAKEADFEQRLLDAQNDHGGGRPIDDVYGELAMLYGLVAQLFEDGSV